MPNVYENVRVAVEGRFKTQWSTRTPVEYSNVPFQQPANAEFVRFFFQIPVSFQVSLGPPNFRMERSDGLVTVQVIVPENSGTKALCDHLDFAAGIFRAASVPVGGGLKNLIFRNPTTSPQIRTAAMFLQNVMIPFQVDVLT